LIGAVLSPALAALSTFSIPSDELSWKDAQQDPLSDALYLEVLDFERFDDGIVPIQPSLTIAVPAIPLDVVEEDLSQEDLDALFDFSQNVAQRDVVALERVVLEPESRTIEAGQVLIPRWGTFPRRAREVQILLGAGVAQISALMNVAESHPRPPVAEKFNKGLSLTPLGIFEQGLTIDRLEERLGWVFDGDPLTHFDRIDRVGQDVKQKWILFMDLGRYFPVRLIRFYPSPDVGVRVAAYTLSLGAPHTERTIAGLNLEDASVGRPGFPKFGSIGDTFPNWVIERRVPVSVADTVAMLFDPPSTIRYSRLDFEKCRRRSFPPWRREDVRHPRRRRLPEVHRAERPHVRSSLTPGSAPPIRPGVRRRVFMSCTTPTISASCPITSCTSRTGPAGSWSASTTTSCGICPRR